MATWPQFLVAVARVTWVQWISLVGVVLVVIVVMYLLSNVQKRNALFTLVGGASLFLAALAGSMFFTAPNTDQFFYVAILGIITLVNSVAGSLIASSVHLSLAEEKEKKDAALALQTAQNAATNSDVIANTLKASFVAGSQTILDMSHVELREIPASVRTNCMEIGKLKAVQQIEFAGNVVLNV